MKKMTILLLLFSPIYPVWGGEVSTKARLAVSNIPIEPIDINFPIVKYPDIMVGTKLSIIVWSDSNEYWGNEYGDDGGSLAIEEDYWSYGKLTARDYNDLTFDYEGSHLPAAGEDAVVWDWEEPGIDGFDLYTGSTEIEAGDWFIIDYNAQNIGDCNVSFYDHRISWFDPNYYLTFSHVRTRDFNNDTIVNFSDFSVLAFYWQETDCNAPGWCQGTDLDTDSNVDVNDLMEFCEYWLVRTE